MADILGGMIKIVKSKMFALIVLLAILSTIVQIGSNGIFLHPINIRTILDMMIITGMMTIGATLLLIAGALDLSVGTVGTMAGMMFAVLLRYHHFHWAVALILCLALAAVFGLINATLVNFAKFPAFIATLGMASVAEGVSFLFSGGANVSLSDPFMRNLATGRFMNNTIPFSIIILLVFFIVYGIILSKTKFGRQIYLVGSNPTASRLVGINSRRISYILFINSSVLGAFAGIMFNSRVAAATTLGITDRQFFGLIAAILGGVSFGGGTGGLGGAFVGLLIFSAFANGMFLLRVDSFWNQAIFGMLLLVSLAFDYMRSRATYRSPRAKRKSKKTTTTA
ncbi:MAG: ABC transporter permease [Oscillospiraceae bacterium]|nr:ABC transporter permease [Oscillospiraceae bacterium]